MPSASEGSTKQSSPRSTSATSLRSPGSQARSRDAGRARAIAATSRAQRAVADHDQAQPRAQRGLRSQRAHERARQQCSWILDRLHAPHRADQPMAGSVERARRRVARAASLPARSARCRRRCRSASRAIARHADARRPGSARDRATARRSGRRTAGRARRTHWYLRFAPSRSPTSRPCSPWMRTGTPASQAGTHGFERREVARVHDRGPQSRGTAVAGAGSSLTPWPGRLVQRDELRRRRA